jgi:DNA-binding PadR family transcriptional regulator
LLKDGIITTEEVSIGKRVRKYYSLTPKGKTEKKMVVKELEEFIETLNKIVFTNNKTSPAL